VSGANQTSSRIVDVRLQGLFKALRLPTVAKNYTTLARQATEQGQPYPEYLLALLEQELSQREFDIRKWKREPNRVRWMFCSNHQDWKGFSNGHCTVVLRH
jgi:hypothetical protein